MDRSEANSQALQKTAREYLKILAALMAVALASCASYQTKVEKFKDDLREHQPAAAAKLLAPKAADEGDDQIVYLFEYATALQMAGQFKDSNKAFMRADDLTEVKDYYSLSRITGSILLNEGLVQYKGEDYEKVLINAMEAVNFLMLGDFENAMVEARRLNEKLYKYKFEAKRPYEQNPFAYYLTALLFEADREWDNAYIQFKKTYELSPSLNYLKEDLIRAARNAHRPDELEKWKQQFPNIKTPNQKNTGEIILVYQQGWGPKKMPHPSFPEIPKLFPVRSVTERARIEVENGPTETSEVVFSVQDTAIKELDDAYAGLIAKRVAGIAAKAVVADQMRQKNKLLGDLTWLGLNLADRADLRQWSSLPETFQVAKLRLAAGKYRVRIVGLNRDGHATGEQEPWREYELQPHKKIFLSWRSVM